MYYVSIQLLYLCDDLTNTYSYLMTKEKNRFIATKLLIIRNTHPEENENNSQF